jgi:uncharacterized protein YggE
MKKIWLGIAGIVILLASLVMVGCGASTTPVTVNTNGQQQGIWVTGEGKVIVTPDVAIISVGIQSQETTVAAAQAKAAAAMDQLMQALKAQGVADKDIQTSSFYISQVVQYDNSKQQQIVVGYMVSNTVTVKIRDVKKAGTTIDAVAEAGGDLTRINGITFTVDDPTNYYNDARGKAIDNAVAKAKQMADKAGVKLGKVTYITENNNFTPIYQSFDMKATAGAPVPAISTSVSPGELTITTTVQITYSIN